MMEKEITKIIIAILATGIFSTVANVIAVDVHLSYVQGSINKLEKVDMTHNERLRLIELEQAKNSNFNFKRQ